jgi:hypothetical protein
MNVVLAAAGPDERTDEVLSELLPALAGRVSTVRLVLSAAGERYAPAARASGLDVVAADGPVEVTSHGSAPGGPSGPVGPAGPTAGRLPQWRCYRADGGQAAVGLLAPSPPWERGLPPAGGLSAGLWLRRVPAGLAIEAVSDDPPGRAKLSAEDVWPDPQRVTIVVGPGEPEALREALSALLPRLPLPATDGVRLYWPRSGAGASRKALLELARQHGTDLIAPVADLSPSGFGAVCHGPGGAAPWARLTSTGDVDLIGSLYPAPPWELSLGDTELEGMPERVRVEHVAAGLCICRPDRSGRGFVSTALAILPDPDRLTVIVDGSADDLDVRNDVEEVLKRVPADSARRLRLLLADAGEGRRASFSQQLADALGAQIAVPIAGWTATPDGRVIALPPDGLAARERTAPSRATRRWAEFGPLADEPAMTWADEAPAQQLPGPAESDQAGQPADQPPGQPPAVQDSQAPPEFQPPAEDEKPEPLADSSEAVVAVLPREYKSTAADRQLYRESAARYQSHLVAVRRVLTQRPGLRAAAAGEAGEAAVTDFAAVLDFMADDRYATTAALRSGGAGRDPRVACVISGFRRLPSFTGAVFTSAFLSGLDPDCYVPGAFLLEPACVLATSSHVVALEGDIDYVIWSQTGKRIAALAVDAAKDEIVFPAGTMFRVLALYRPPRPDERALAFLREAVRPLGGQLAPDPAEPFDEMDRRVLERLGAAASMRNGVPPDERTLSRPAASGPLMIGLSASGQPFRASTS